MTSESLQRLVTGATGYIGTRREPLKAGHSVRVLARRPERLRNHAGRKDVEITNSA